MHEKPDPKKVLEFEELAQAFGYSLGVPGLSERLVPVRHGRVTAPARAGRGAQRRGEVRERPMTVALPSARELRDPAATLSAPHAEDRRETGGAHPLVLDAAFAQAGALCRRAARAFRAGIRRVHAFHFADPALSRLVVHRVLKAALAHPDLPGSEADPYQMAELRAISVESSEAERRADGAERELMNWKTAQFMEQHLGEEYEALIISVQKFGFFVELIEIFVEGLVPINRLEEETGERCVYRERDHAIVSGRGGKSRIWRLGDRVRVLADRIDPIRRRVEFALAT